MYAQIDFSRESVDTFSCVVKLYTPGLAGRLAGYHLSASELLSTMRQQAAYLVGERVIDKRMHHNIFSAIEDIFNVFGWGHVIDVDAIYGSDDAVFSAGDLEALMSFQPLSEDSRSQVGVLANPGLMSLVLNVKLEASPSR